MNPSSFTAPSIVGHHKEKFMAQRRRHQETTYGVDRNRYQELKRMLEDRRRELLAEVQGKIRTSREGSPDRVALDPSDGPEASVREDIDLALVEMKTETLNKIDQALRRLDDGTYGRCFECHSEISKVRLRALPFALRCKDCEEARENADNSIARRRPGITSLFFDMSA